MKKMKNEKQKTENLLSCTVTERPSLLWCLAAVVRWFTVRDRRQDLRRSSDTAPVIVTLAIALAEMIRMTYYVDIFTVVLNIMMFYLTIGSTYFVKTRTYVALFCPHELSIIFSGVMCLELSSL